MPPAKLPARIDRSGLGGGSFFSPVAAAAPASALATGAVAAATEAIAGFPLIYRRRISVGLELLSTSSRVSRGCAASRSSGSRLAAGAAKPVAGRWTLCGPGEEKDTCRPGSNLLAAFVGVRGRARRLAVRAFTVAEHAGAEGGASEHGQKKRRFPTSSLDRARARAHR